MSEDARKSQINRLRDEYAALESKAAGNDVSDEARGQIKYDQSRIKAELSSLKAEVNPNVKQKTPRKPERSPNLWDVGADIAERFAEVFTNTESNQPERELCNFRKPVGDGPSNDVWVSAVNMANAQGSPVKVFEVPLDHENNISNKALKESVSEMIKTDGPCAMTAIRKGRHSDSPNHFINIMKDADGKVIFDNLEGKIPRPDILGALESAGVKEICFIGKDGKVTAPTKIEELERMNTQQRKAFEKGLSAPQSQANVEAHPQLRDACGPMANERVRMFIEKDGYADKVNFGNEEYFANNIGAIRDQQAGIVQDKIIDKGAFQLVNGEIAVCLADLKANVAATHRKARPEYEVEVDKFPRDVQGAADEVKGTMREARRAAAEKTTGEPDAKRQRTRPGGSSTIEVS